MKTASINGQMGSRLAALVQQLISRSRSKTAAWNRAEPDATERRPPGPAFFSEVHSAS